MTQRPSVSDVPERSLDPEDSGPAIAVSSATAEIMVKMSTAE